ncbi:MAG: PKD domain-containing protein, partial [Cytophagaceae bacterium]
PHLNVLYFSSDGHEGFGMLDIIKAEKSGGLWAAVENAGEPFNSAGDDFAFFSDSTGKSGFFSSNRLKDDDDVFQFSLAEPLFLNPDTLKLNSYCVTLFEETTFFTDTLPYVYEWNLGNGQIKQGKEVQHCFPGPGEYAVYLNILDTLTGLRHAQEAEYRLELKDYEQLYISSADTIPAGTLVDFDASASNLPGCMIKSYFWDFGDGYRSKGNQVSHAFTKPGIYYVRLGSELIDASGKTSEKSVIKKITILNSSRNLSYEK